MQASPHRDIDIEPRDVRMAVPTWLCDGLKSAAYILVATESRDPDHDVVLEAVVSRVINV
jgi:hypothetical protein